MAEAPLALLGPDGRPLPPAARAPRPRAMVGDRTVPHGMEIWPYDAARWDGQEMGDWFPLIRSPDDEINLYRDTVVARARDLHRNDGWAKGGINRILDSAIGLQFRLAAKPDWKTLRRVDKAFDDVWAEEFATEAQVAWADYAEDVNRWADGSRHHTMTQMFRLALAHKLIDGDALGVMLWLPENIGPGRARYATALQIIDPDRLSNPLEQVDTAHFRNGVEINDLGAAQAYHIRRAHQYDMYNAMEAEIWDRVPRETDWGRPIVVHDFETDRAGQSRGISVLASVMPRFKMLTRYDGAEVQAALLQTILSFFIESPYAQDDVRNALEGGDGDLRWYQEQRLAFHDQNPITAGGVRIPKLFPGEKMAGVTATRPHSNFDAFEHAVLRNIAAGLGISAEQLTQNWSKVNYSSARAALLESWKTLIRRRTDFALGFATPVYASWLEEAVETRLRAAMPRRYAAIFAEHRTAFARCRWLGPGRGWVDPLKERQGAVLGLDAGFSTLEKECAEQGEDWEDNLEQRARELRRMRKLGIPLPDWTGDEPAQKTIRPQ
ncbi:MAG: phage portal protein [Xanthomonadaceae bacterium]|nr:phage portal protein [Xanthomonadaceae bacterium]